MATQHIEFSSGLPTTELPAEPAAVHQALEAADLAPDPVVAVEAVVAEHPTSLFAWAALGDSTSSPVARYAAYRVGYHRGLDALRANGWRGSGYVRWSCESNRGFLRCLVGLSEMARAIGENAEAERTAQFLLQLDPSGPWASASVPNGAR